MAYPQNTNPIFGSNPNVQWTSGEIAYANTVYNGTGTSTLVWTAGATGSTVIKLVAMPGGLTGSNVATVARFFLNNGQSTATASNNLPLKSITLPATTAIQTASLAEAEYYLGGLNVPANYKIYGYLGTAVASGYVLGVYAMDF